MNAFKQQQMDLEVYNAIQERVENKVMLWDSLTTKKATSSSYLKMSHEGGIDGGASVGTEEEQHLLLGNDHEKQEKLENEIAIESIFYRAERLVLESKSTTRRNLCLLINL